jgi:hypothetical protein
MRKLVGSLLAVAVAVTCGCDGAFDGRLYNVLAGKDRTPPMILAVEAVQAQVVSCTFDEPVWCDRGQVSVDGRPVKAVSDGSETVLIDLDSMLAPGTCATVTMRACDGLGNSVCFSAPCWGKNERLPAVVINEFTTKGSAGNPDRIELLVLSDGNLAGLSMYDGIGTSFDSEYVFESLEVKAGDRPVLWYAADQLLPDGLHYDAGPVGLGGNNGVLSVCASPGGRLLDALLYSNRTSASDTTYGGFGTKKVHQRALSLLQSESWATSSAFVIAPEDGIDSTYSTATRSMGRNEGEPDSDAKSDWHVVPTGKASFGQPNCPLVHEP